MSRPVLDQLGVASLGGALLDLGVSSYQVDTASRGFAMMKNGPLDMRMSRKNPHTAADIVNTASPTELTRIFREYGEEPRAMHIAARIAALREHRPMRTTFDLAAAVTSVVPRTGARHPATRIFQALRIAVNDELGVLTRGLEVLAAGSRMARASRSSASIRWRIESSRPSSAIEAPNGSIGPSGPSLGAIPPESSASSLHARWTHRAKKSKPTPARAAQSCASSNASDSP